MKWRRSLIFLASLLAVVPLALLGQDLVEAEPQPVSSAARTVLHLGVDGPISPASAAHIERGIQHAVDAGMQAIVLEMDTPGGLDTSMRSIIKAILASPVPVIGYVAPSGSRAASAGTYILYACHVAAMAPATNLGAATPIQLINPGKPGEMPDPESAGDAAPKPESPETLKAVNDAVAYIRSLAEKRGRNADWAEQAVREAVSLSASEALEQNVIDLIAANLGELLEAVDGRSVDTVDGALELTTAGALLERWEPDWRSQFLAVIANPSVAYLLMLIGIFGLMLEGYHPGAIVPGVVGAISLLLALYAFQLLPVNYAGLGLVALGVILMVAESFVPAFGALGFGGIVSFVVGSVILMDTDVPGFGVPITLVVGVSLVAALLMVGVIWLAMRAWRQPQVSGAEEMAGLPGVLQTDLDGRGRGRALVHGESWRVRSQDRVLRQGDAIRVLAIDGLELVVAAADGPDSGIEGDS